MFVKFFCRKGAFSLGTSLRPKGGATKTKLAARVSGRTDYSFLHSGRAVPCLYYAIHGGRPKHRGCLILLSKLRTGTQWLKPFLLEMYTHSYAVLGS